MNLVSGLIYICPRGFIDLDPRAMEIAFLQDPHEYYRSVSDRYAEYKCSMRPNSGTVSFKLAAPTIRIQND
jgi:hypothetical protein